MKRYVLDSFALLAYAEGESGAPKVYDILTKSLHKEVEVFVCVVNWGEMYYIALREGGQERAELYRETIAKYPITLIEADLMLTLQAAKYKAFHKISFADAFAAALTKGRSAELVTGDKELISLEGEIKILWI